MILSAIKKPPFSNNDLVNFWSHDFERNPAVNKNDQASSYNQPNQYNGIDSLALIDPSFLVKPPYFNTKPSHLPTQSTLTDNDHPINTEIESCK